MQLQLQVDNNFASHGNKTIIRIELENKCIIRHESKLSCAKRHKIDVHWENQSKARLAIQLKNEQATEMRSSKNDWKYGLMENACDCWKTD